MKRPSVLGAARFYTVDSDVDLDEAVQSSSNRPVLLFLDDPYCPISNFAAGQLTGVAATIAHIDVASFPELGRSVQRRTGIRHESPQIILFHKGRPVWSASHGRITKTAVRRALDESQENPEDLPSAG